jgi:hypothetical protein
MTDEMKYAGQDEYIVRNYLVNVMKLKINKNHQKSQKDSEKHLYL